MGNAPGQGRLERPEAALIDNFFRHHEAEHEENHAQNHKYDEQELRDGRRARSDAGKAKKAGYHRDDGEEQRPLQHDGYLLKQ
ncbi:hypothetical protein BUPH_02933 [Paraburkholderia phenoliruptrix BR3459a]|uniref:Uncharacterized protein n=1 Tax=Paraburkholderia phenoliruptrix BR3459a TaxID=1229205 RepID=K0DSZ0_9BURK|nr:hypothetical protein BUPH_02933 [Paraburkholderia phenoliruptrix BR3459a]